MENKRVMSKISSPGSIAGVLYFCNDTSWWTASAKESVAPVLTSVSAS